MSHLGICAVICLRASCFLTGIGFCTALYYEPSGALAAAGLSFAVSLIISIPVSCCIAMVVGSTFSLPYRFTSCLVAFIVLASAIPAGALIGFLSFIGENDFKSWGIVFFTALPIIGVGCLSSRKHLRQIYDQQQPVATGYL